jgi:thiamine biosynthesis protein ThiS
VPDGITVQGLLEQLEIRHGRVAVERNLEIVPKRAFADTVLQDGDSLEIVTLVGGG